MGHDISCLPALPLGHLRWGDIASSQVKKLRGKDLEFPLGNPHIAPFHTPCLLLSVLGPPTPGAGTSLRLLGPTSQEDSDKLALMSDGFSRGDLALCQWLLH